MTDVGQSDAHQAVVGKLSTLDRLLPVWIGIAMAVGLLLGRLIPGLNSALDKVQIDGISLPIALGLLIMMYPVLAKVRYDRLDTVTGDRKLLVSSLLLNWVLGPALMFALAWLLLPDLAEYRTGGGRGPRGREGRPDPGRAGRAGRPGGAGRPHRPAHHAGAGARRRPAAARHLRSGRPGRPDLGERRPRCRRGVRPRPGRRHRARAARRRCAAARRGPRPLGGPAGAAPRAGRPAAPPPARRVRRRAPVHRLVPAGRPAPQHRAAAVALAAAHAAPAVGSAHCGRHRLGATGRGLPGRLAVLRRRSEQRRPSWPPNRSGAPGRPPRGCGRGSPSTTCCRATRRSPPRWR